MDEYKGVIFGASVALYLMGLFRDKPEYINASGLFALAFAVLSK